MKLKLRQEILTRIYEIYDDFIKDYELACKKKCVACCTRNVTMTSLEAYRIVEHLQTEQKDLLDKVKKHKDEERYQPKITVNQMVDMIVANQPLPEEKNDPIWGNCPLMTDRECPVYELRPFECRSFCSKVNCEEEGMADMDPFVLTVNNVVRQYIEHIDQFGVSGNFTDMILKLNEEGNLEILRGSEAKIEKPLLPNRAAETVMIPPEHQERIKPVLEKLQEIKLN